MGEQIRLRLQIQHWQINKTTQLHKSQNERSTKQLTNSRQKNKTVNKAGDQQMHSDNITPVSPRLPCVVDRGNKIQLQLTPIPNS